MKTYKTWEVIKELTENPEKEFETTDFHGKRLVALNIEEFKYNNTTSNNAIVTKSFGDGVELLTLNDFMKNRKWKEVKKTVDFMTAFKAFKKGKTIYSLRGHSEFRTRYLPAIGFYRDFNELDIANGKWYIED